MLRFDFLVIGSGIGGLGFALKVAEYGTVAVVCKSTASVTNTCLAQGGISAVTATHDSVEQHVTDTLAAGAGLCDEQMVQLLVKEAPACIDELMALGINFTRTENGNLDLGREGGHAYNRIVHTQDHTGLSIQQALLNAAEKHPHISLLENHFVIDLLLDEENPEQGRCTGAQVLDLKRNVSYSILAKAVMLASGGIGQVYQHTTNPGIATGDGVAMAARAGAVVSDMEFIQFHPTAFYDPGKPTFLISEAARGFGAELKRPDGTAFMHQYHPHGSLAPRDVVARAIQTEMQQAESPFVYLDLRHLPASEIKERFPKIYTRCLESGFNLTTDLIPVVPAAHYICGGVKTDHKGRTSVPGLYACGEVACTGIHGANRLASNSLPEAWIFAKRAADHASKFVREKGSQEFPKNQHRHNTLLKDSFDFDPFVEAGLNAEPGNEIIFEAISEKQAKNTHPFSCIIQAERAFLKSWMWEYAGIVRTVAGLEMCRHKLEQMQAEVRQMLFNTTPDMALLELQNMVQVSLLIVKAALKRKKSVGCHFVEATAKQAILV